MAKFYQRYLPPTADQVVQYGYRGTNYTVNGQFYFTTNNVEQVGNYQYTCAPSRCGAALAPITVPSVFEPSLGMTPFDHAGSRFSGEYNAAKFNSFGTYNSSGVWTFKNTSCLGPLTFSVQDSTGISCLCGCVCGYTDQTNDYLSTVGTTATYTYCSNLYNWQVIEHPTGCFNCFVPNSIFKQFVSITSGCGCTCVSTRSTTTNVTEQTSGTFTSTIFSACQYSAGQCSCLTASPITLATDIYTAGGNEPLGVYSGTTSTGDQFYYGTCDQGNLATFSTISASCNTVLACCKQNYINGVTFQLGGKPAGATADQAVEFGSRIFLANINQYTYYMHFNSLFGGIQGSDGSTNTGNLQRLKLKAYSASGGTTTILSINKGLGGFITPSNPDQDTEGSSYRFYQLYFNGNDFTAVSPSSTGSITLARITLNNSGGTSTYSTYALKNSDNSGFMSISDQQQIYSNSGYLNNGRGQLDNMSFRRQTVHRVWISIDSNGTKRLHMGVYNTNGTGLVLAATGFNNAASTGNMFRIYSWEISDAGSYAKYMGNVSTAQFGPRYFCPLDPGNVASYPTGVMWNTLYVGCTFSNDIIMTLNITTGIYQYQNTMPYAAARLFKDKDSRWCAQVFDNSISNNGYTSNYIDVITSDVGQTISLTTTATSFVYTGTTVSSSILVNVYNYLGARVAKPVTLSVIGQTANPGITFGDGTYFATVTSSASTDTSVTINLISAAYAKIVATVSEI